MKSVDPMKPVGDESSTARSSPNTAAVLPAIGNDESRPVRDVDSPGPGPAPDGTIETPGDNVVDDEPTDEPKNDDGTTEGPD